MLKGDPRGSVLDRDHPGGFGGRHTPRRLGAVSVKGTLDGLRLARQSFWSAMGAPRALTVELESRSRQ